MRSIRRRAGVDPRGVFKDEESVLVYLLSQDE
jgi:hypothetical protein